MTGSPWTIESRGEAFSCHGELNMKKSELLAYKEKLQAIRARLRNDVSAMAEVALRKSGIEGSDSNAMPIHMAELGSDNFEQEFTLGLMEAEGDILDHVEAAI